MGLIRYLIILLGVWVTFSACADSLWHQLLLKRAQNSDPIALFELGKIKQSADLGYCQAWETLGEEAYFNDQTIQAVRSFLMAYHLGCFKALNMLGYLLFIKAYHPIDQLITFHQWLWCARAGKQGCAYAVTVYLSQQFNWVNNWRVLWWLHRAEQYDRTAENVPFADQTASFMQAKRYFMRRLRKGMPSWEWRLAQSLIH